MAASELRSSLRADTVYQAELSHLSEALGPYKDIAQSLDAHHLSLTHRTALVERAEEDLNDHRREVQKQEEMLREDKQAFSRTLESSAHNSQVRSDQGHVYELVCVIIVDMLHVGFTG